jgi:flagellar hook-associated protein 3 FlgL
MSLRVTNLMNNPQSLLDLQRIKQAYAQSSEQISSGQAIVDIGDDPSGTTQILGYQASISLNGQYVSQINTANSQLQSASTVLTSVGTDINQLMELAQSGMGSGATSQSQAALASQVQSLRTNLISLGNTQVQGRYIFAGTDTTQAPFDSTGSYQGNGNSISLNVSPSISVATNVAGDQLYFGGSAATSQGTDSDLLAQANALATALQNNDSTGIQTAYNNLSTIQGRVNTIVADVGSRQSGLQDLQSGLTSLDNTLTSQQSSIQSVDYPTAIVNLNAANVAEQATLSTMAKASQNNLFDYLS